ncbi:hypothetical protein IT568_02670 [bacterium]|nr:hypothetical protein [bacterium]
MEKKLLELVNSPKIQKRWNLAEQDRIWIKLRDKEEDWFVRVLEKQAVFLANENDKMIISRRQLFSEGIWLCSEKQVANFVKEQNNWTDEDFEQNFQNYLDKNDKGSSYESVLIYCLSQLE